MPRKYEPKTDRKNAKHKDQKLPDKFQPGFLANLDGREKLAKALESNYAAIVSDIGGPADIGHVKASLIERFVWLEGILQGIEHEMVTGKTNKTEAIGKWIQGVNSLTGLAKVLGIERRATSKPWMVSTETNNGNGNDNGQD